MRCAAALHHTTTLRHGHDRRTIRNKNYKNDGQSRQAESYSKKGGRLPISQNAQGAVGKNTTLVPNSIRLDNNAGPRFKSSIVVLHSHFENRLVKSFKRGPEPTSALRIPDRKTFNLARNGWKVKVELRIPQVIARSIPHLRSQHTVARHLSLHLSLSWSLIL